MFMDDLDGGSEGREREELPTGLVTMLARCYTPGCGETEGPCYAWSCPRRVGSQLRVQTEMLTPIKGGIVNLLEDTVEEPEVVPEHEWEGGLAPEILENLPESERNRQTCVTRLCLPINPILITSVQDHLQSNCEGGDVPSGP